MGQPAVGRSPWIGQPGFGRFLGFDSGSRSWIELVSSITSRDAPLVALSCIWQDDVEEEAEND
jgi:hypothetical protein